MRYLLTIYDIIYRLEILKADSSLKSKAKRNEWTWKAQTDVVKWQATPLRAPLLRLPAALAPPALECFTCVRAYCGDLQPAERAIHQDLTEVKCVYTVLMVSLHCIFSRYYSSVSHSFLPLRLFTVFIKFKKIIY